MRVPVSRVFTSQSSDAIAPAKVGNLDLSGVRAGPESPTSRSESPSAITPPTSSDRSARPSRPPPTPPRSPMDSPSVSEAQLPPLPTSPRLNRPLPTSPRSAKADASLSPRSMPGANRALPQPPGLGSPRQRFISTPNSAAARNATATSAPEIRSPRSGVTRPAPPQQQPSSSDADSTTRVSVSELAKAFAAAPENSFDNARQLNRKPDHPPNSHLAAPNVGGKPVSPRFGLGTSSTLPRPMSEGRGNGSRSIDTRRGGPPGQGRGSARGAPPTRGQPQTRGQPISMVRPNDTAH